MRTTIQIDDEVFKAFKKLAAEQGTTLAAAIEDALRADLLMRERVREMPPLKVRTERGKVVPGVDINSNAAIYEAFGEDW